MQRDRVLLLRIFLVFLFVLIGMAYAAGASNRIFPDQATALITQILAIYSVQLAVILGGTFAQNKSRPPAPLPLMVAAAALSVAWNSLLLAGMLAFTRSDGWKLPDLQSYLETVSKGGSFLVAGMLSFFFAGAKSSLGKSKPNAA
jgi:hypothetical protein